MSFTITRKLTARQHFPSLGVEMPGEEVETDVTYTAVSLTINGDGTADAQFQVVVDGCYIRGSRDYHLDSLGEGNPLDSAEDALKAELEAQEKN
ncbi:hypothetical protein ACYJGC_004366 [Klebsiella pneumoniae]|uniref:hypothetical protein n=1 Tax=Klebsiella pneumoniae TaxID=573 RepID=UPI001CBCA5B8|nr:hypothetical protein [Klebsiella pneumoniae]EKX7637479.1 hypothetical protein [Klebsiella pneumoniae]ELA1308022.1 hypothetical protein [Klebsiella pneumoniae]MBZ1696875.1 hypothetical protein [Klebsiella pneumoniae]HDZ2531241.1 hypothetical protein [Klebsiella pneumoniae]HDZ2539713.1 hypothetical protein [Klebsiella pneumoniae]